MAEDEPQSAEEAELRAVIEAVLSSPSDKRLVIGRPGTGKTTLFRQLLELAPGEPDQRIVLTFINNPKDDLEDDLGGLAQVFTLHSCCPSACCTGIGHSEARLRRTSAVAPASRP